jgi:hypothetical protein
MFGPRRRRLPAASRPDLGRDERVVAWARATGDDVVVATNLGLWLPGSARLGWHEVHKASWSGRQLTVIPARELATLGEYAVMEDRAPVSVPLVEPDGVPEQVRTRVSRSVAYTIRQPLPSGGMVRVAARRVPGRDGLRWTVRYEAGAAPGGDTDTVADMVARARAALNGA